MHSYLIVGKSILETQSYIQSLCDSLHIHPFDISLLETQGSVGIEDIRFLQKKIILLPLKGAAKAWIIKEAHTLTVEAQNALLKVLEEPPPHTYIFLESASKNLLPTIQSRCSIIILSQEEKDIQNYESIYQQITSIKTGSISEKLHSAESISLDKATILQWIENAIKATRIKLLHEVDTDKSIDKTMQLLLLLLAALRDITTTNVTIRFTAEQLFLAL